MSDKILEKNTKTASSSNSTLNLSQVHIEKEMSSANATTQNGTQFTALTHLLGQEDASVTSTLLENGTQQILFPFAKDNFTLDQLFSDFHIPTVDQFVFDSVDIHIEMNLADANAPTEVNFTGNLRIAEAPLNAIASALNIMESPLLTGNLVSGDKDLSDKLTPETLTLSSEATLEVEILPGLSLTKAAFMLSIKADQDQQWQINPAAQGTLELALLTDIPILMDCAVAYSDSKLSLSARTNSIKNAFDVPGLILDYIQIETILGEVEKSVTLKSAISIDSENYQLSGAVTNDGAGIYTKFSALSAHQLKAFCYQLTQQDLNLPDFDFNLGSTLLGFATESGTYGDQTLQDGLTLESDLSVFGHTCSVMAHIDRSGVEFSGHLEDLSLGPITIKQAQLSLAIHTASSNRKSAFAITGITEMEGIEIECKLTYEKYDGKWQAVIYGALNADSFSLSSIFSSAKDSFIDTLSFSKVAMIYSTFSGISQDPDFGFTVQSGLQLRGSLQKVPALSALTGNDRLNLELAATLGQKKEISITLPDTRINLGKSVTTSPFKIALELSPMPAFNLIFGLDLDVPKQEQPLHFDLSLSLDALGATGAGTMKNYWVEPFGLKGLQVGPELALQIGIIYQQFLSTGTPSELGFAGGLRLGDITAQMAMNISVNPTEQILMGHLEQLTPANLIGFINEVANLDIPQSALPDILDIHDLELYIAPNGGSIGTISFERGFSFNADLMIFGKKMAMHARLADDGLEAGGYVDRLDLGPLSIHGKQGDDAEFDFELTTSKQSLMIDGEMEFLGSSVGLFADISKNAIEFSFEQNFLGQMKYTLEGKSTGTLSHPEQLDFYLAAQFDSNITSYLKNDLAAKIRSASNAVSKDIDAAQADVKRAQKAYEAELTKAQGELKKAKEQADKLLNELNQALTTEKNKHASNVKQARAELTRAKATYDNALKSANSEITRAEAAYKNALKQAQNQVDKAKRDYNSELNKAKADVNKAERAYKAAIKSANRSLSAAKNKVSSLKSNLSSAKKSWKKEKKKTFPNPFKLAKYGSTIAGLESAIAIANGSLSVAQKAFNGIAKGTQYTAFESAKATLEAVKRGGKYIAFESAKKALDATSKGVQYGAFQTAKEALKGIQKGAQYTAWQAAQEALNGYDEAGKLSITIAQEAIDNVGNTAVYSAFYAAQKSLDAVKQGSSFIAFNAAKAALEGAKQSAGATLKLAEFTASHAGDLIDVRKVRLAGHLKGILNGQFFDADIDLSIFGKSHKASIDFDVNDIESFLDSLFKDCLYFFEKTFS